MVPGRTKEQLQQIYEDLLIVREVINELHELGELWPTPMNGKTWEEEKNEHYFAGINAMTDLIRSGRIKSCEMISGCEGWVQVLQNQRTKTGFWNHYAWEYHSSSVRSINNDTISIDELINDLELAGRGRLSEEQLNQLNENINSFGDSACDPRAMLENRGNSIESENNFSLPKVNNVNCHFKV
ncbi:hypothetical protein [Phaeodactylibacter sp.]|uniref:hypothetical protein n=1 Tax=Phaeodactylibacter sp. TaxID=1940289 RepID=UPI0025F043F7|nr:hypothetical protein [Phaeodactylibacter sp.]MCI5091184.1 hypothetical protein [Phaeodactylibacter sp.]